MKKILICLLISMCCFTPFSVFAEEEDSSSYVISTNPSQFLSLPQLSLFDEYIRTQLTSNDLYIYYYEATNFLVIVSDITSFDGTEISYSDRILVAVDGGRTPSDSSVTHNIFNDGLQVFFLKYGGSVYYGQSLIPAITVSTNVSGGGGSVSGSGSYVPNSLEWISVQAFPDSGYSFDFWEVESFHPDFGGNSTSTLNPYTFQSSYNISFTAHFRYTGLTPPDPTPTPTPTPEPDDPLYEISTDFKYLLSNPAIASLVQYAINDLGSNTWWIERELYYYETASCPSGSSPLYSTFGYVERFVLYNYSTNGLQQVSDSIYHQGQSSLGCLISSDNTSVVIPQLESSPRITETLFYGFDLFEIPEADFYQLLVEIKNTLNDSSVSNSINNINNSIVSGNGISQNVTSSLVDSNSSLNDAVSQYDQAEKAFTDDFKVNVDAIDTNFSWGSQFLSSANFVRTSFNELVEPAPIYNMVLFSLILGFALFIIGRLR